MTTPAVESTPTGAVIQEPTAAKPDAKDTLTKAEHTAIVNKTVQERLARERKASDAKRQADLDAHAAAAVEAYRDENGLTDDALDKFAQMDKAALEVRTHKGKATKAEKALEALQSKYDTASKILRENLVSKAIIEAAAPLANKPSEIATLLSHRIFVDEETWKVQVLDDNGDPSGESIDDAVKGYLEQNDHHMRPVGGRGAGSFVSPDALPTADAPEDSHAFRTGVLKKLPGLGG